MLTLFLIAGLAMADGIDCVDCCKQAGLVGCPTRIRAHGPESHIARDSGAWRVSGIWWLDCDAGASYDDGATVVMAQRPMAGQILRGASPSATVSCFARHCTLPQGACLRVAGDTGEFALSNCQTNKMLTEAEMKTLGSEPATPDLHTLDLTLPAPATRCAAGPEMLTAAEAQVHTGDSKVGVGDLAGAANTYRAALTIDPCSAGGWAGLGRVALEGSDPGTAVTALKTATGLRANDPESWALLGTAHAALGETQAAVEAFDKALELNPSHSAATAGRAALVPAE